jgi:hypothetical protein
MKAAVKIQINQPKLVVKNSVNTENASTGVGATSSNEVNHIHCGTLMGGKSFIISATYVSKIISLN